ncbi:MAG: hypothetical protein N3A53_03185 [Verrucomicrobiae bacterium]|nr:hypothetical protein [Verrucomicrobiae bacterium]
MAVITINLLAEEQLARKERAHDPLKIVLAVGLGLVTVAVGLGGWFSLLASRAQTAHESAKSRLAELEKGNVAVQEFQQQRTLAEALVAVHESRVLVAPLLAQFKDAVPDSISLRGLQFQMVTETKSAEPVAEGETKRPKPQKTERMVVRLDGVARGTPPELTVDRFLQTMRRDPQLAKTVEEIQLVSISRQLATREANGAAAPVATFTVECRLKDKKSREGKQ